MWRASSRHSRNRSRPEPWRSTSTASASKASGTAISPIAARSGGARSRRRTGAGSEAQRSLASTSPTPVRQRGPSGTGRSTSSRCDRRTSYPETCGASRWTWIKLPTCEASPSWRGSGSPYRCPAAMDGQPSRMSASSSTPKDGTACELSAQRDREAARSSVSSANARRSTARSRFRHPSSSEICHPDPPPDRLALLRRGSTTVKRPCLSTATGIRTPVSGLRTGVAGRGHRIPLSL